MSSMRSASALLVVIAVALGCGEGGGAPIEREIARLETSLDALNEADLPDAIRPMIDVQRTSLEKAKAAAGPEYRLYRLRDPFVGIQTLSFVAEQKQSAESVEAFRTLWTSRRARFDAPLSSTGGTLLERGLAESAITRAERLFDASLPYAKASDLWSGVYYLGEAEGNLRFREFVHSIAAKEASRERTPSRATVAAALEDLDSAALAFFGRDITDGSAIAVSVRLKEARELLDAGRLAGAVFLAVEARVALTRRGGPRGSYPANAAAPAGSMRSLLRSWADAEDPPMDQALREEVAPFFGALFAAKVPEARTEAARVTVTLVRWPYT